MYQQVLDTIADLAAQPLYLPTGLAHLTGDLRGAPVVMKSQAWQSEQFRLLRYTHLYCQGKIETFNFVLYPREQYDAPIFASDWVLLGNKLRIAVMDAMPLFPQEIAYYRQWVVPFQDLQLKSTQIAPLFARKLSWSTKYLGDSACLATEVPADALQELGDLWKSYLTRYLSLTENIAPCSDKNSLAVQLWHRTYNRAHREVENKRNPYMMYFGQELGKRYNEEFLFSDTFGKSSLQPTKIEV